MFEKDVIKNVLLQELGVEREVENVDRVISAYEKRYGKKVSNWNKLRQDLKLLLNSDYPKKNFLSRLIVRKVLDNGLNYVYVSSDEECRVFREALLKTKQKEFMRRVIQVFN